MTRMLLLLLTLVLGACATGPAPVSPSDPAASRGSSAGATPAMPGRKTPAPAAPGAGVVDSLLDEARSLRGQGDLAACFARLERALRIAPQYAPVYLELARSHSAAGNDARAAASAERGLLYCSASECRALRRFTDF